jgi:hypothetical protein
VTFNGENSATDYDSGTELHFEYAVVQNFSRHIALGINGYFYNQVTGDSGPGATSGGFEGRVAGIGPVLNINFEWGGLPATMSLKYFDEFATRNRLEGDAGYLTLTLPLQLARQ